MDRLTGRVALITGASSGIGAAIARRLASEGAAATLALAAGVDLRTMQEMLGHSSIVLTADT